MEETMHLITGLAGYRLLAALLEALPIHSQPYNAPIPLKLDLNEVNHDVNHLTSVTGFVRYLRIEDCRDHGISSTNGLPNAPFNMPRLCGLSPSANLRASQSQHCDDSLNLDWISLPTLTR